MTKNKEELQLLFDSMGAGIWLVSQSYKPGGQSLTAQVHHSKTAQAGVLKYLRPDDERNKDRFIRELKFLADPSNSHPNIIQILDWSQDENNLWYVSELGNSFESHWEKLRVKFSNEPDSLLEIAIGFVREILNGLAFLHKQEPMIVHRDIKPANIVMIGGRPVLIDFGTVFLPSEDRLTDVEDAVGNRRFSPDSMMSRMDHITPWLDIFQLSQVLVWMISHKPIKNWQRPLDYRYVRYLDGLSQMHINSLFALTGLCSDEALSPKTGEEMDHLIQNLFYFPRDTRATGNELDSEIIEGIEVVRRKKIEMKTAQEIEAVERARIIDGHSSLFVKFYMDFKTALAILLDRLNSIGINVEYEEIQGFDLKRYIDNTKAIIQEHPNPYVLSNSVKLKNNDGSFFEFKLTCNFNTDWYKSGENPFYFHFFSEGGDAGTMSIGVQIKQDGSLWGGITPNSITVKQTMDLILTYVKNPTFWNY